jgi:uncharacterized protein (TIGR03083 family)
MEKARCIEALLADSAALAEAARLGLDAAVPSCPGWSMTHLVQHVGRVHRSVERRVRNRESERHPAADIILPPRAELIGWFEAGVDALAQALAAAEPDMPVWNWSLNANVAAFWWRRMAQETAVHRWDGQAAYARQQPIDADVAVDGVDELLDVFLPISLAEQSPPDLGGTVQLRSTDRPGHWLTTVRAGKLAVRRNQPLDVADTPLVSVSASASDLLLFLWKRLPAAAPAFWVKGDAALLARFAALTDLS